MSQRIHVRRHIGLKWSGVVVVSGLLMGVLQARLDVPPAPMPAATDDAAVFEHVTLEMSLKPFRSMEPEAVRAVCAQLFRQWAPLI